MDNSIRFLPVRDKKEKVANMVVNRIKDALISGVLKPGDKLPPIADLAAEMGVGISSVREAIKMLEALCVLESRHGEGTFICTSLKDDSINPLTFQLIILPQYTRDLMDFRKMFETSYTFMAMENATDGDLEKVREVATALLQKVKTSPPDAQDEIDFHGSILRCTHNQYVIKVGETLLELFLATLQKKPAPTDEYHVAEDHMRIYEALRDKNRENLQKELDKSFEGWKVQYFPKE